MTPKRPDPIHAWLAAMLLAFAGAAAAAPGDAGQQAAQSAGAAQPKEEPDTLILSDTLNYDDVKKQSTFEGNVLMTRGLMTLRSDTLVMREDAQGFQYGTATVAGDKRVVVRNEIPEKFELIEARGLRAEYNGRTDEIEMIGQAIVTKFVCGKAFDTIQGERIKYNQTTNVYQAYSGPQSAARDGRVRSLATPSAKAQAAAQACQRQAGKG